MSFERSGDSNKIRQIVVRIRRLNDLEDPGAEVVVADAGESWATLITLSPIQKGVRLAIDAGGNPAATAEVVDWVWDYWGDTVRVSISLIEKNEHWPL